METPFVDIHTHNHNIDKESTIEIRDIDIDDIVNVDVSSFYSIGIHPWKLGTQDLRIPEIEMFWDWIRANADDKNFLAIGETGIDRVYKDTLEQQKEIFIKHIELSEECHKPLIIHSVRSYPDIISLRKLTKASQQWIIHGFQGNEQSAEQLLKHDGIYLSLGEFLFRDDKKASELLKVMPMDRLFFETDDSDRSIIDIYEKVSSLISVNIDEMKDVIFNNFIKIFGDI